MILEYDAAHCRRWRTPPVIARRQQTRAHGICYFVLLFRCQRHKLYFVAEQHPLRPVLGGWCGGSSKYKIMSPSLLTLSHQADATESTGWVT